MSTVVFAVGARPNFVKMAPVIEAVGRQGLFRQLVVHTGQHYDERMSAEILDDLAFPKPDRFLGIGSGSPTYGRDVSEIVHRRRAWSSSGYVPVDVANGWALPRLTTTRPRRGWQGWNGRQGSLRAPLSGPAGRL